MKSSLIFKFVSGDILHHGWRMKMCALTASKKNEEVTQHSVAE